MGISRLALHEVLSETAIELGAQVRLGVTVERFEQDDQGVDVHFTDGTDGRYDLLVGADGVYSKIRGMLFGDKYQPRFTGQGVWRYNFPRDPSIDHLAAFVGSEGNAGLVPLADNLMYMYVTSEEPGNIRYKTDQLAAQMRSELQGFDGLIGELREQIAENEAVVYKPLEVVFVYEDWYKDRVMIIGDAAHAATPHLGQGAGMAIEDALVLSLELKGNDPLETKLQSFMKRRFERCRYIAENSILAGERELAKDQSFDRVGLTMQMLHLTAQPI